MRTAALPVFVLIALSPVLAEDCPVAEGPVAWWDLEQVRDGKVVDRIAGLEDTLEGRVTPVEGVHGEALRFDGFTTCIVRNADSVPVLSDELTIEAWIALAAYPWNDCPIVARRDGVVAGYSLDVGPRGELGLGVAAGEAWHACRSEGFAIPLRKWTHVAGRRSGDKLTVLVNGKTVGELAVPEPIRHAEEAELRIGADTEPRKPSHIHREFGTLPSWYSLDGIVDEVRIYARARSDAEIGAEPAEAGPRGEPDLPPRVMPSGPPGPGRFGAYTTRLAYYPEWDDLWRVDDDPDVLVRFDKSPVRVVFWRGSRYSPAWVSETGLWMADQSVEAWNDAEGCFEHMQDRLCRYSHVRVIESHDARVVVHWRYAPVSVYDHLWRVDEKTGRACWVDEYYYAYPDMTAVRHVSWKTGTLGSPRQFQESLPFTHPGQLQSDVIHTDFAWVANLDGESEVLSFVKDPEKSPKTFPEDLTLQLYNFKSEYKPFIAFEPGNRMHYVKDRKLGPRGLDVPGACNHWPVGQALCDGRTVQAADRPTHFLGFPISDPPIHEKDGRSWWNGLYGMSPKTIEELVPLARSWARPAPLSVDAGRVTSLGYDRAERAYRLRCEGSVPIDSVKCTISASERSPVVTLALLVESWGPDGATLEVDGKLWKRSSRYRVGHRHRVDGSDLVLWIELESTGPVPLTLRRERGG